jgi:hypothetical protein
MLPPTKRATPNSAIARLKLAMLLKITPFTASNSHRRPATKYPELSQVHYLRIDSFNGVRHNIDHMKKHRLARDMAPEKAPKPKRSALEKQDT